MRNTKKRRDNSNPFAGKLGASKQTDTNMMPPIFSFEKMMDGTGYSVNCCDIDHQAALSKRLFLLSRHTWREIVQAHRHGIGTEKISRRAIKTAIPASITDDVTFLALRYKGKNPIVGYRDGRTFHVLFIDNDFTVYSHG